MNAQDQLRFDAAYQQHLTALILQGKAPKTIESYAFAVRRVAQYFDRFPDDLTLDELKRYFCDLIDSHSWSAIKIDRNGLRFFYQHVLGQPFPWVDMVKPPRVQSLPDLLSRDEIARIIRRTTSPRYRAFWLVAYSMGLRLGETLRLTVADIDATHMRLHVRDSKGNKDRFVILPELALTVLRHEWRRHHHPVLLFPGRPGPDNALAPGFMDRGSTQKAFAEVVRDCGIRKKVSIHSLRHSYATHLIEAGLNLLAVQAQLGHTSPNTTAQYVHMTELTTHNNRAMVNSLVGPLATLFEAPLVSAPVRVATARDELARDGRRT